MKLNNTLCLASFLIGFLFGYLKSFIFLGFWIIFSLWVIFRINKNKKEGVGATQKHTP